MEERSLGFLTRSSLNTWPAFQSAFSSESSEEVFHED